MGEMEEMEEMERMDTQAGTPLQRPMEVLVELVDLVEAALEVPSEAMAAKVGMVDLEALAKMAIILLRGEMEMKAQKVLMRRQWVLFICSVISMFVQTKVMREHLEQQETMELAV